MDSIHQPKDTECLDGLKNKSQQYAASRKHIKRRNRNMSQKNTKLKWQTEAQGKRNNGNIEQPEDKR